MGTLDYHKYLEGITASDVEYVRRKDKQYNASWKQRGGVGAFFTIVRPWDRLINMLDPTMVAGDQREAPIAARLNAPVAAYDILGALYAEKDMAGPDGSLLACVRDVRRYLLLVEAELCNQSAATSVTSLSKGSFEASPATVRKYGPDVLTALNSVESLPQVIVPRYPSDVRPPPHTEEGRAWDEAAATRGMIAPTPARMPALEPLLVNGDVGKDDSTFYAFPWRISKVEYLEQMGAHGGDAWRQLLPTLYFLEPSVPGQTYKKLSPAVQRFYICVLFDTPTVTRLCYVLDLTNCPADIRANYPTLTSELNNKEHGDIQEEYRGMYEWFEGPSKWVLRTEFHSWMQG